MRLNYSRLPMEAESALLKSLEEVLLGHALVDERRRSRRCDVEPGRVGERFGEPMAQFLVWLSPEWRITPKQWEATQGIPRTRRQGACCGGEPRR